MGAQAALQPGITIPDEPDVPFFIYTWESTSISDTPTHNPHVHPYNEILAYISSDPDDPHNLGADYSIYTGKEFIEYCFSKPFISSSAPLKHVHTPLIRRNMKRSVVFIGMNTDFQYAQYNEDVNPTGCVYHDATYHAEADLTGRIPKADRPKGFAQHLMSTALDWDFTRCHNVVVPPIE